MTDHDKNDAKGERAATAMVPGDDVHLSLLGAPMGWNFLTGKDFANLLVYGRAVWAAARTDTASIVAEAVAAERESCAVICDEMREHWCGYKDTALLNGDVDLSNAASGEPRAAESLAALIRARATPPSTGENHG